MIALLEDTALKAGVVYFPLTEEWFYAVRGNGTFKNGVPLSVPTHCRSLKEAWVDLNQYGDAQYETTFFAALRRKLRSPEGARLVTSQVPHSGISMRLIEGKKKVSAIVHDNNPKKVKQAVWDVAAPQLIVEEAGGIFLNLKGERYNLFQPEPIVVASSISLAKELIALLD